MTKKKPYNPNIGHLARQPKDPARVQRGKAAGKMLQAMLQARTINIDDLAKHMRLPVKTTLANHIRTGKVTLLELVELHDFWDIDVNSILITMKDETRAELVRKANLADRMVQLNPSLEQKDTQTNTPSVDLNESEESLAKELGLDTWGTEEQ